MKKLEIIKFLNESSFTKGGIFDYFEEIDIESGRTIYLSLDENFIEIFDDDCKKAISFKEFIEIYNKSELSRICY